MLHPYQQVKDLRSGFEVGNIDGVLDGDLDGLMEAYLRWERSARPRGGRPELRQIGHCDLPVYQPAGSSGYRDRPRFRPGMTRIPLSPVVTFLQQ